MIMKKITSFLLVVGLIFTITSCAKMQAKHQIRSLESLTEKVEKKGDLFTRQDWTEVSREYDEICTKMNQCEYTNEQLQEIGRLKGRFYAACTKKAFNSAGGLLNGLFQQAGGAIDGFMESMSESQKDDNEDDANLDEQVDEALRELESIFE